MDSVNIVLALISIISFFLALFSFVRNKITKATESANVEVMKERIESLYQGLVAVYHSTDAIVQIPKSQETDVRELQNLGRISRAQVFVLMKKIEKERGRLKEWKFGKMVKSEPLDNILPEEKLDVKQANGENRQK